MVEGAVEPRHAHVVKAQDVVSQHPRRPVGLLGHGNVAGAAGGHHDLSQPRGSGEFPGDGQAGVFMVVNGVALGDFRRRLRREAGDEHRGLAVFGHGVEDAGDLRRGLPRAVDHLRRPLADLPVEIHLGIAQVFKGRFLEGVERLVHAHFPGFHALEQGFYILHGRTSKSSSTPS